MPLKNTLHFFKHSFTCVKESINSSSHVIHTFVRLGDMHIQTHSLSLFISLLVRWASSTLALWSGASGEVVSRRDPVQRVLDRTQLWHHQLWQHPVCRAYRVPVHHHGGMGGHPLQRKFTKHLFLVQSVFFFASYSSASWIVSPLLSYFSPPFGGASAFLACWCVC